MVSLVSPPLAQFAGLLQSVGPRGSGNEGISQRGLRSGRVLEVVVEQPDRPVCVPNAGSQWRSSLLIGRTSTDREEDGGEHRRDWVDGGRRRSVGPDELTCNRLTGQVYDAPRELPADAEGSEMRKLRAEMHRRMLGNGYCARPVGLDCHFESICESCTFFVTTAEFRPTLQRQRDDAAAKGQVGRQKIFEGLLSRLERDAS